MSHPKIDRAALRISDLPEEILPMIFKNLSTKDRKAVKLVCQCWFEVCNRLSLTNEEVLNCLGIYQLSDIFEFLTRSERRCLNLKFDFVKFNQVSSFWTVNGPRIRSISFKDCQFHFVLDDIIICCENLYHLAFTCTMPPLPYKRRRYHRLNIIPFYNLDKILEKGIVRENLKSLKIDVRLRTRVNLSDRTMCQLFLLFPQLTVLKITYYDYGAYNDFGSDNLNAREARNFTDFSIPTVLSYLTTSKDRLEKLKLHFPLARLLSKELHSILETLKVMNRLKELSINLGSALKPENIESLLLFKPLKSLIYSQWSRSEPVPLQWLLWNSTLEHLEVWAPIDSSITTKAGFEKLMSSSLKSCKLIIKDNNSTQDSDSLDGSLAERQPTILPKLSVRISKSGPGESSREMVQFLQYFQNLRHLSIDDISHNELQSLLKYQTKLKSLIMKEGGRLKNLSQDQINVFKDAFSQLTELEHLELSSSVAYIFLRSLSSGPTLTNLRYLKISLLTYADNMIYPSDFLKLADATPCLEGLYVHDTGNIPFAVCVSLCTKLRRLRFLRWDKCPVNDPFCTDDLFRTVFTMCPSLRLLFYTSIFEYIYFLDTINEKVVCVLQNDDINKPYTFVKPRIAGYTVNWLTFPKKVSCEQKDFF